MRKSTNSTAHYLWDKWSKQISISIRFHIWSLKCRKNWGCLKKVMFWQKQRVWISSTALFHLPYFRRGMCHLRFWCSLWSDTNRFCCFGSAVQVCAPRGIRKSFLIWKLYKNLHRNPPNTTTKPYEVCAQKFWGCQAHCGSRGLDNKLYSSCGEDRKILSYIFSSGSLHLSLSCTQHPHTAAGLRYVTSRRHLTSSCGSVYACSSIPVCMFACCTRKRVYGTCISQHSAALLLLLCVFIFY